MKATVSNTVPKDPPKTDAEVQGAQVPAVTQQMQQEQPQTKIEVELAPFQTGNSTDPVGTANQQNATQNEADPEVVDKQQDSKEDKAMGATGAAGAGIGGVQGSPGVAVEQQHQAVPKDP